jgi:hypothetical protein
MALWSKKGQSVKISTRKGPNREMITITKPNEVRDYIQEVWAGHFESWQLWTTTTAEEWIGQVHCIKGETDSLMRYIDIEELQGTIKSISNNKAPGPMEETIEMIKWVYKENLLPILALFNTIMSTGFIPVYWKMSNIFSIYKGGEPMNPLNYHPIALLLVLYKLFTKIVNN